MQPAFLAAIVVTASGAILPRIFRTRAPYVALDDLAPFLVGFLAMIAGAQLQDAPASTWSALIDLGSFVVGTSLVVTSKPGSWPRRVGALILGIHSAQVLFTNEDALFG